MHNKLKNGKYRFVIPVYWSVSAELTIKASSLDTAMLLAKEASLPSDGDYIDDSFEVNAECAEALNSDVLELIRVDEAPRKELPLLVGYLKSEEAQRRLEERLKGD